MSKGNIFLLPMTLGDSGIDNVIPKPIQELTINLKFFIVENIKTTRRYLKKIDRNVDIDLITFFELNKHTNVFDIADFLKPCLEGNDVGIISEAGCPGIADPGANVVALAHQKKIKVVPLVGPSSILLALISSGFNGQKFAFNGYLNKDKSQLQKEIQHLERLAIGGFTQLFMDTPFRSQAMLMEILKNCNPETLLCIASDITLPSEKITTKSVKDWSDNVPNLAKKPCIFALGK